MTLWVCICVWWVYTEVCENFLLRGNRSPLEVQPLPHSVSSDNGRCLGSSGLSVYLFFLDMSLHVEGKMVRPGKTPRKQEKKPTSVDIREVSVENSPFIIL